CRRRAAWLQGAGPRDDAAPGVEPRRGAARRVPGPVGRGARQRRVRQRVQGGVGDVPDPRAPGRAVPVRPARRRQGRAARVPGTRLRPGGPADRCTHTGGCVTTLRLPDGTPYTVGPAPDWPTSLAPPRLRRIYAAAHVVAKPAPGSSGVRP